jgi:hypothetical protein
MFSPFQHEGLKVRMASGFLDDLPQGYMLRAWLHLESSLQPGDCVMQLEARDKQAKKKQQPCHPKTSIRDTKEIANSGGL